MTDHTHGLPAWSTPVRATHYTRTGNDGLPAGQLLTFTGTVTGSPRNNPVKWVSIETDRQLLPEELETLTRAGARTLLSNVIIPVGTLDRWYFQDLGDGREFGIFLPDTADDWVHVTGARAGADNIAYTA